MLVKIVPKEGIMADVPMRLLQSKRGIDRGRRAAGASLGAEEQARAGRESAPVVC